MGVISNLRNFVKDLSISMVNMQMGKSNLRNRARKRRSIRNDVFSENRNDLIPELRPCQLP